MSTVRTTDGYTSRTHRARHRRNLAAAVLIATTAALTTLGIGAVTVPPDQVVAALLGFADPQTTLVVAVLRLPRVLVGLAVGAALGLAGALTQTVTRNPLASPGIIGVTSGASVGAVAVAMAVGSAGGVSGPWAALGMPTAAAIGAVTATFTVITVARTPERVVLVGVGMTVAAQSLVAWMLTWGNAQDAARATTWLTGSLGGSGWTLLLPVLVVLLLAVPVVGSIDRDLAVIPLGDDLAAGLGVAVTRVRWTALLTAAVLAAAAVAAAGPIAFVGLVAPRLAARLWETPRPPALGSAACGAALVSLSDLLARNLFTWAGIGVIELPVGIVTAAVGGIYLVSLLTSRRITA
ncbi:iron complex transport system permease protein [Austwickia chelonae]|uniref:Putative iron siderophore ABC transporter permease protein n=1 Tax=Austwickia chelonae NBRC 105200 TaxID=1184607 RepID=K6VAP0_9MICO|nr:iron ABC transporter permease [Austwickia chelonae]GAB79313.1 putative iron siderophore ABC transporter permease protein [Austwickia chelonae NBRC 105200]SEW38210.1 iron complex transport system permease protein [Austwickia chelonae]